MQRDVAVLVSPGRHPMSLRPRRADQDSRALELALRKYPENKIDVIHAGSPADAALIGYVGMGLSQLSVIEAASSADIIADLLAYLTVQAPPVIITGRSAEVGEGSGMSPYLIARSLGRPLIANVIDYDIGAEGCVRAQTALPEGKRRVLGARLPLVMTVGVSGPRPRPTTYAAKRAGDIVIVAQGRKTDRNVRQWKVGPARRRPKAIATTSQTGGVSKLAAMLSTGNANRAVIENTPPSECAAAILKWLQDHRIFDIQKH